MSRKAPQANEDELLQRRLAHAQWITGLLAQPDSLASLTVAAYAELLDELTADVAVEAHREARTGRLLPEFAALPPPAAPGQAAAAAGPSSGAAATPPGAAAAAAAAVQPAARVLPPRPEPLPPLPGVKGPTDVFGQVHPGSATDVVVCMNCGRKAQAGKFAYHLEKCLGKGRTGSGRQASRRAGA